MFTQYLTSGCQHFKNLFSSRNDADTMVKVLCISLKMSGIPPEIKPARQLYTEIKGALKPLSDTTTQKLSTLTDVELEVINKMFDVADVFTEALRKMDNDNEVVHIDRYVSGDNPYERGHEYARKAVGVFSRMVHRTRDPSDDDIRAATMGSPPNSLARWYLTLTDKEKNTINQCYDLYPTYYDAVFTRFSTEELNNLVH